MKKYLALLLIISTVFLAVSCIAENNSSAPEGSDVSVPNESSRPQKEEDEYSPIESFTFGIRSDDGYRVLEYKGNDPIVKIPPEYQGLPVIGIASYAFSGGNAQIVYLPETITYIEENAFWGNQKIYKVVLNESLEVIGNRAFAGCTALKDITVPASIKEIGSEAFAGSGLENITLPENLETIPSYAFSQCKFKEFELPSGLKSIGMGAFGYCQELEKITLNSGLESLDYFAFTCTAIKEISIPDTVVSMNESVFAGCTSLKDVYFEGDAPKDYSTEMTQEYTFEVDYTVYYNEDAEGFTSPEWYGYTCLKVGESLPEEQPPQEEQPAIKQLDTYFPEEFFKNSRFNTGDAVFDISVSFEGEFDDEAVPKPGYVNFIDKDGIGQNWKLTVTVSENIKCFAFIEIDEGIAYRVGKVLYVHNTESSDEPLMLHTYINDVTRNRGLCYITGDGEVVYYSFGCNMNTGEVGYGRDVYNLGNIPKGTYCPKLTGTEYKWEGNDIFEEYFNNYVLDQYRTEWTHIGVTEGVYTDFTYKGYTKFDVYRVEYNDTEEYYAVPCGESQIEAVYKFQFDDTMVPVWINPEV
ncbi:MAG: leucine-rich repeat domain-containing protein [Clostridia bacterium]|nr:leucine-rich repeat domain-containing protein [Clostridia bacterium]